MILIGRRGYHTHLAAVVVATGVWHSSKLDRGRMITPPFVQRDRTVPSSGLEALNLRKVRMHVSCVSELQLLLLLLLQDCT